MADYTDRITECFDDYSLSARDHIEATSSQVIEIVKSQCESQIEILLASSWLISIGKRRAWGSPHGGYAVNLMCPSLETPASIFDSNEIVCEVNSIVFQAKIEGYRADFIVDRAIRQLPENKIVLGPKVVIECDGHDFHERTKEQAQRDKERDRIIQAAGYFVLRFTGSEIWKSPTKCAAHINDFLDEHICRTIATSRKSQVANA